MKLAVFDDFRIGVVHGDHIRDVTPVLPQFLDELPEQRMNWIIQHWPDTRETLEREVLEGAAIPLTDVRLRAPSPAPRHVFALPANFREHLGELGDRSVSNGRTAREKGFFLKAPGSLSGADDPIELPRGSLRRFDHECELGVVIGKTADHVHRTEALDYVFGYTCLVDLSMRIEPQEFEEERTMRKSFATFTPLGPFLVTAEEVGDTSKLVSRLSVNGELRQHTGLDHMIVGIPEAIELISSVLPIRPGDVIASGTPAGVGPVVPGDVVEIAITRVGQMTLPVREREEIAPRPY